MMNATYQSVGIAQQHTGVRVVNTQTHFYRAEAIQMHAEA